MADPVIIATGHTYDRACIERWLQSGNKTCPVTGMRLRHHELTPNFALRTAIQVYGVEVECICNIAQTCDYVGLPSMQNPRTHTQEWAAEHNVNIKSRSTRTSAPVTAGTPMRTEEGVDNIMTGHDEIVWAVEVAGNRLFSASADKTIRVWDIPSRRCIQV